MATGTIQKNMVLLWENPNPSASFGAQTVSLTLSGYSFVLIEYRDYTASDAASALHTILCGVGGKYQMLSGYSKNNRIGNRTANVTASGITFSEAQYNNETTNTYNVPLRIYGIKA